MVSPTTLWRIDKQVNDAIYSVIYRHKSRNGTLNVTSDAHTLQQLLLLPTASAASYSYSFSWHLCFLHNTSLLVSVPWKQCPITDGQICLNNVNHLSLGVRLFRFPPRCSILNFISISLLHTLNVSSTLKFS